MFITSPLRILPDTSPKATNHFKQQTIFTNSHCSGLRDECDHDTNIPRKQLSADVKTPTLTAKGRGITIAYSFALTNTFTSIRPALRHFKEAAKVSESRN